jgi:hypothetical protein
LESGVVSRTQGKSESDYGEFRVMAEEELNGG